MDKDKLKILKDGTPTAIIMQSQKNEFLDNIVGSTLSQSVDASEMTEKQNEESQKNEEVIQSYKQSSKRKKLNSYEEQVQKENEVWSKLNKNEIENFLNDALGEDLPEPTQKKTNLAKKQVAKKQANMRKVAQKQVSKPQAAPKKQSFIE